MESWNKNRSSWNWPESTHSSLEGSLAGIFFLRDQPYTHCLVIDADWQVKQHTQDWNQWQYSINHGPKFVCPSKQQDPFVLHMSSLNGYLSSYQIKLTLFTVYASYLLVYLQPFSFRGAI